MKFLSIYKTAERTTPPSQEEMNAMNELVEEGMKSGWLVAVEGCLPSVTGARVRKSNGKVTVTDGRSIRGNQGSRRRPGHPASEFQGACD
jgi:hypothetical protein